MSLSVVEPGWFSLLVDRGRPSSRSLGVPVGGAADTFARSMGNALVGNPKDAPALEITLVGPTLRASAWTAAVVFGAPFRLTSDRQALSGGTTFTLSPGEELTIDSSAHGARAYLCVAGGFQAPAVLGSQSALNPIQEGELLTCFPGAMRGRFLREEFQWNQEPSTVRAVAGPQAQWFLDSSFFSQQYRIAPASNRMGLRLQSEPLPTPGREMRSEPVCPGSVQVTADGQAIVLGVDGQTIGGYPKIAQVIAADLDKLGQLRPGDPVRFARVGLEEAAAVFRAKRRELAEWVCRLRTTFAPLTISLPSKGHAQ